jgi:hypothetical protein
MVRWSHHFKVHIRTGTKEKIIITHTGIPFEGVQVYNLQGLMRKIYLSHDSFADQQAKADLSQSNSPLSAFSLFLLLPVSERVDYSTSPHLPINGKSFFLHLHSTQAKERGRTPRGAPDPRVCWLIGLGGSDLGGHENSGAPGWRGRA